MTQWRSLAGLTAPKRVVAIAATCAMLAACTPEGFPENPFERTEQGMTAPALEPLDSGFPTAADAEASRLAEEEAFALMDEAEALGAQTATLFETEDQPDDRQADAEELRQRAADLRDQDLSSSPEPSSALTERSRELREQADALRTRSE
ncbi:MAG: hypothetical protein AAGF94_16930 [Pseudomonadota bacterium]